MGVLASHLAPIGGTFVISANYNAPAFPGVEGGGVYID